MGESSADREMTLAEWVDSLRSRSPTHRAVHEYNDLMEAAHECLRWLPLVGDGAMRGKDVDDLEDRLRAVLAKIEETP